MALRKLEQTHSPLDNTEDIVAQVVTLTSWGVGDSFKLSVDGGATATAAFVQGTNGNASDLQTAMRTLTGDASLTVTGTDDAGPFTITFVAADPAVVTVEDATGCTGAVTSSFSVAAQLRTQRGPYLIRRILTETDGDPSTYEVTENGPGSAELADENPADVALDPPVVVDALTLSGAGQVDSDTITFTIYYESRGDWRF